MPPLVLTLMTELPPTVWTPSVTTIGESVHTHRCCRRAAKSKAPRRPLSLPVILAQIHKQTVREYNRRDRNGAFTVLRAQA